MSYDTLAAEARENDGLDGVRLAALGRARPLLDLLDGRPRTATEIRRWLEGRPEDDARAAVLALMLAGGPEHVGSWPHRPVLLDLIAGTGGWTPGEAGVMLQRACRFAGDGYMFADALGVALAVVERLDADGVRALAARLKRVNAGFARADVAIGYRAPIVRRLQKLLGAADEAHVPVGLLPARDAWAAPLRDLVTTAPTVARARFVRHLASLSAPRPSQKWRRACAALADEASARDAVAGCLRALVGGEPLNSAEHGPHADWVPGTYHYRYLVHQDHGDVARGIVWAAALTGGPGATRPLAALALRAGAPGHDLAEDLKLAGGAINALGAIDDPGALEALRDLHARIKNRALRKQIDTALRSAAERQGITPEQLVERTVPAHGLRPDGSVERTLGEHTARVSIVDAATVRLTFTGADGRASKTAPAAVKDGFPDELKELKALAKEVRGTLSSERARIEGLMSQDRVWPYDEWCEYYRDHPVTGAIVRGLVWEFQDEDGAWHASMTGTGGPARVRLWHPIRAAADDVRAWRERVMDEQIRQPFKQAFREIYLLTPAEEETSAYSNRFAAHIVRYRRLYALFKERGWQANFLGRYDGGYNGEARRELGGEWRACFYHEPVDVADWGPEHATTDQVRFERRDGRRWRETPVADVPPVVFSEAMRDVDLFVAVTSIAADPEWADRGEDRYTAYWRETTFGALTASAEVRRAALERVLPRTKIADRCSLDGRYLVVRGRLRTYRIHLGSANVLMDNDGSYLCIVQARGRKGPGRLYLPFEDERLSLILSKAFLLAADHTITDATILTQIKR
ncbi:DUF4132 domain-containing protein [Actinomadura madurae]|uniref:DUF4132 domain-containing protein n=1 Tax=Actinomadura madurae TaxID=1993 RepID=UPI0020262E7E|nr:DUF4132 domain-containing protein [Actinomadura madurae]MCP9965608.1 DUF4132 domain-containing protein [Actinomadura madurae]MCP9978086.1 DUF4132 domain-containing protein [Actinomadura madurae]URN05149.1 DUF4132 domain-containing protein [Actinomadura madurae]